MHQSYLPIPKHQNSICKSSTQSQQDRHIDIHLKDKPTQEATNHPQATYVEIKSIHDAFHNCFHRETFIAEASSALGPHMNHKRARFILA